MNEMNNMNKEGWICPRCGKVNAPWLPQCFCNNNFTTDPIKRQNEAFGVRKEVVKKDYAFTDNEQQMVATCNRGDFMDIIKKEMEANPADFSQAEESLRKEYEEQEKGKEIVRNYRKSDVICYIVRDKDGDLSMWAGKPDRCNKYCKETKDKEEQTTWDSTTYNFMEMDNNLFSDLKWEDEPLKMKLVQCVENEDEEKQDKE